MTPLDLLTGFATTGTLGPLHCGASLNELIPLLGAPWDGGRISERSRWPRRFGYDSVELVVCRCRLVRSISLSTWRADHRIPGPAPGQWLADLQGITLSAFTAALACAWRISDPIADQVTVSTRPPGSTADFVFVLKADHDGPSLPEPLLHKAGAWTPAHECPPLTDGCPDDGLGA